MPTGEPMRGHIFDGCILFRRRSCRFRLSRLHSSDMTLCQVLQLAYLYKGIPIPFGLLHILPMGTGTASGSMDDTVRMWSILSNKPPGDTLPIGEPLHGHLAGVSFTPDSIHVVSASESDDYTIRIWDAESGAAIGKPLLGRSGLVILVACAAWLGFDISQQLIRDPVLSFQESTAVKVWRRHNHNKLEPSGHYKPYSALRHNGVGMIHFRIVGWGVVALCLIVHVEKLK